MRHFNKHIFIGAFFLLFSWLSPLETHAKEATLTNIVVTNTRDDLLLYMNVEGCFTREMNQAIENGIPTTFSFFVTLDRMRNFWFDSELADITVTHTIKYNNLKKEFTVTRSEAPGNPVVTHVFAEARKAMAEVNSLKVCELKELVKGCPYQINVKAQLEKVKLPLYLHYVFFFVSLWDFETDWYTIDFYY